MAKQQRADVTQQSAQSTPGKRATKRSPSQQVEAIRKSTERLILRRVDELLANDAGWLAIQSELKEVRHQIHLARLRTTKRSQRLEGLQSELQATHHSLEEAHANEAAALHDLMEATSKEAVLRERTAERVRREFGFSNIAAPGDNAR